MKDRTALVIRIAADIVVADIANGQRTFWIHEMSESGFTKIINKSVEVASQIVKAAEDQEVDEDVENTFDT